MTIDKDIDFPSFVNTCSNEDWNDTPCEGCGESIATSNTMTRITTALNGMMHNNKEAAETTLQFINKIAKTQMHSLRQYTTQSILKLICNSVCFVYDVDNPTKETVSAIMHGKETNKGVGAYAYVAWTPFCHVSGKQSDDVCGLIQWGAWMVHTSTHDAPVASTLVTKAIDHVDPLIMNACSPAGESQTLYVVGSPSSALQCKMLCMTIVYCDNIERLPVDAKYIVIHDYLAPCDSNYETFAIPCTQAYKLGEEALVHASFVHNVQFSRAWQYTKWMNYSRPPSRSPNDEPLLQRKRKRDHDDDTAEKEKRRMYATDLHKELKEQARLKQSTLPPWVWNILRREMHNDEEESTHTSGISTAFADLRNLGVTKDQLTAALSNY